MLCSLSPGVTQPERGGCAIRHQSSHNLHQRKQGPDRGSRELDQRKQGPGRGWRTQAGAASLGLLILSGRLGGQREQEIERPPPPAGARPREQPRRSQQPERPPEPSLDDKEHQQQLLQARQEEGDVPGAMLEAPAVTNPCHWQWATWQAPYFADQCPRRVTRSQARPSRAAATRSRRNPGGGSQRLHRGHSP